MQNEDYDIAIQRYLEGDMSSQEKTDFEGLLASDNHLREQLEEYKNLGLGIEQKVRRDRWSTIQNLEKEAEDATKDKVRSLSSYWPTLAIAASIALLIASYFIFLGDSYSSQDLYAEYFEPYPAIAYAPDRNESEIKTLKEQAYAAYSNENYAEAISFFKQILSEEDDPLTRFYLGNAYLQEGNSREAVDALSQFLEYDTEFKTQASWYLGLAYLANDQIDRAKEIFINLSESNTSYAEKANLLVNNLNEITMSKSEKDQVNQEQNVSDPNKIIRPDPKYARVTDTRLRDEQFIQLKLIYITLEDGTINLCLTNGKKIRNRDVIKVFPSENQANIIINDSSQSVITYYELLGMVNPNDEEDKAAIKRFNELKKIGTIKIKDRKKIKLKGIKGDGDFPLSKLNFYVDEDSLSDGDRVYYEVYRENQKGGKMAIVLAKVN